MPLIQIIMEPLFTERFQETSLQSDPQASQWKVIASQNSWYFGTWKEEEEKSKA